MDNKRYVEERIRKIDGFLLAVNSKIERILEENDNHPSKCGVRQ